MSNYTPEQLQAIKAKLMRIPLSKAMRKMAKAGGDYIRNKLQPPPVKEASKDQPK